MTPTEGYGGAQWNGGAGFDSLLAFQNQSARKAGMAQQRRDALTEPESTRFRDMAARRPEGGLSR